MHTHDLRPWQHEHQFGAGSVSAERSTRLVVAITALMMAVEIGAGWWFNSIALLADAATSVLALAALLGGWLYGWAWLDPAMGIVGAVLVALWAKGLLQQTGKVLLDREMDHPVTAEIRDGVESMLADSQTRVADLHVWRVGRDAYACALVVVTHSKALTADQVRACFAMHEEIRHSTVEIQRCPD